MLITTAGVGIKNVWVNNKENVQHVLNVQHILDSIDFISSYICFIQQGGGGADSENQGDRSKSPAFETVGHWP